MRPAPKLHPLFAPATRLLWHSGVLGALEAFARAGFQASEVWAQHLWECQTTPEAVRARARELGMRLSLHAPSYDLNPLSNNPEIRAVSRRQVLEGFETALRMGSHIVVVHPGFVSSSTDNVEEYWARLEDFAGALQARAAELGLTVGIEAMEKKKLQFVTDLPALERLTGLLEANGFDRVGLTLDVAHASTVGDALEYVRRVPRVVHAHLSDSSPSKTHALMGEGRLPMPEIVPVLLERMRDAPGLIALEGRFAADEAKALEKARLALTAYR